MNEPLTLQEIKKKAPKSQLLRRSKRENEIEKWRKEAEIEKWRKEAEEDIDDLFFGYAEEFLND